MTAKEFLESKKIKEPTYEGVRLVDDKMEAYWIVELLEEYHKAKLKLLGMANVVKSLPTDNELDEAAVEYCKSVYADRPEMDDYQDGVEAFDAGAVWMKERLT